MGLHTMYEAERRVTLPSNTSDGGEITVPYLDWHPGVSTYPCEAMLLDPTASDEPKAIADTPRVRCGRPAEDEVHAHLEMAPRHNYLASTPQPGMYLTLDNRLGFNIPASIAPKEAEALIEFIANAIAIGAGYASIYYTKRKMPFRG